MATKATTTNKGEAVPTPTPADEVALTQVWERRLLNPMARGSQAPELKAAGFELHWVDSSRPGRLHQAMREQGWVPVHPDELRDSIADLGLTDLQDGRVRRGIKGEEILMKIPAKVFERIRRRKAEINTRQVKNTRTHLRDAAASRFGDQAGDFVEGRGSDGVGGLVGTIVDKTDI